MTKSAEEVGIKLLQILSTAVIPEILQSDNGNEFLGQCIKRSTHTFTLSRVGRITHNDRVRLSGDMLPLKRLFRNGWQNTEANG